jgi:hypothetical protein
MALTHPTVWPIQFVRVHLAPLRGAAQPLVGCRIDCTKNRETPAYRNFQREIPQHLSLTTPTTQIDSRCHRQHLVLRHLGPDGGHARCRVGQLNVCGNIYVGVDKR